MQFPHSITSAALATIGSIFILATAITFSPLKAATYNCFAQEIGTRATVFAEQKSRYLLRVISNKFEFIRISVHNNIVISHTISCKESVQWDLLYSFPEFCNHNASVTSSFDNVFSTIRSVRVQNNPPRNEYVSVWLTGCCAFAFVFCRAESSPVYRRLFPNCIVQKNGTLLIGSFLFNMLSAAVLPEKQMRARMTERQ